MGDFNWNEKSASKQAITVLMKMPFCIYCWFLVYASKRHDKLNSFKYKQEGVKWGLCLGA